MLELLLKGSVMVAICCAAAFALRKGSASERHLVWRVAVLSLTVLPILILWGPHWKLKFPARTVAVVPSPVQTGPVAPMTTTPSQVSTVLPEPFGTIQEPGWSWQDVLAATWIGVSTMLFLRLLIGFGAAWWIVRRSRKFSDHEGVAVQLSYRLRTPATSGLFRPVILLPATAMDWPDERLRVVLAHEMAHIRRKDWFWNNVGGLMVSLNSLNPLAWYVFAHLRLESEMACDDSVLAEGYDPRDYAGELLMLSRNLDSKVFESAVLGMARTRGLKARILSITDLGKPRRPVLRAIWKSSIQIGLALVIPLMACKVIAQQPEFQADPSTAMIGAFPSTAPIWHGSRSVKVVDSANRPVADAQIAIYFVGDFWGRYAVSNQPLKTDGQGICEFSDSDFQPDTERGGPVEATVYAPGYAVGTAPMYKDDRVATAKLSNSSKIRIRFVDLSNQPVSGVHVKVRQIVSAVKLSSLVDIPQPWQNSHFSATTGADGEVEFADLPAGMRIGLEVRHPNFVTMMMQSLSIGDRVDFDPIPIPAAGKHVAPTVVRLTPGGRITGTVTANGRPVSGLGVMAQQTGTNGSPTVKTDASGHFSTPPLRPGTYTVKVMPEPEGYTDRPAENIEVNGQDVDDVDVRLESGGEIKGRVRYRDGSEPDRLMQFALVGPGRRPTDEPRLITVERAEFRTRVPKGDYDLYLIANSLSDPIGQAQLMQRVHVEAGQNAVEIVLPTPPGPGPATSNHTQFASGEPQFYGPAKLSGGHVVRLAFLQTAGEEPWKPDGSRASESEIKQGIVFSTAQPLNLLSRSIYARLEIDEPRDNLDCLVQVPHRSETSCWQTYGDSAGHTLDVASFRAPDNLKTTDLRLGIGHGPFQTAIEEKVGGPNLHASPDARGGIVKIFLPKSYLSKDVRIVGLDSKGHGYLPCGVPSVPFSPESDGGLEYRFCGVSVGDLHRIRVLVRSWDWVTFTGLQLWPNG